MNIKVLALAFIAVIATKIVSTPKKIGPCAPEVEMMLNKK